MCVYIYIYICVCVCVRRRRRRRERHKKGEALGKADKCERRGRSGVMNVDYVLDIHITPTILVQ